MPAVVSRIRVGRYGRYAVALAAALWFLTSSGMRAAEEPAPANAAGSWEMLQLYEIDKSHFARLTNRSPWQDGENELLLRLMYRLRSFRPLDIEGWGRPLSKMTDLTDKPESVQGEFWRLRGRVTKATLCEPLPEVMDRYEMKRYYRCEMLLEDERAPAIVFSETIPQSWKLNQPMDERAGACGMFLKLAGPETSPPTPVFVAPRVAWYPETLLGDLGMDYGLFDDLKPEETDGQSTPASEARSRVRDLNALRLTNRSGECFYQMLAAVCRAPAGELLQKARESVRRKGKESSSVVPLFQQAQKHHGDLVLLSGVVRQVVPIRVTEAEIRDRFGVDRYYQLSLFTDDSQGNPLVVCVPRLPKGMPRPQDRTYAEQVTVAGFFFNTWAYRRETNGSDGRVHWQLAPLLFGQEPVWHPRPAKSNNFVASVVFGTLFVLSLLGIWGALWIAHRGDREFRKKRWASRAAAGDNLSFGEQVEKASQPDRGQTTAE